MADKIVGKPFHHSAKKLYYEQLQHLSFLFKKSIRYEPVIQEKLKKYIVPGNLVFDIGANIGQYSLLFSELVGEEGTVVSFEPDFKNFAFLKFNTLINRCANVECLNIGLGKEAETLTFYRDTKSGGRMGSFKQENVQANYEGEKITVQVRCIADMIELYGEPDFIKIDVEGFEELVVLGGKKPLPHTTYLIEVREETKQSIFEFFNAKTHTCFIIDFKPNFEVKESSSIPKFANLLFVPAA